MSTVTIHSDNTISVNDTITGYCVAGGRVLKWHNNGHPVPVDLGYEAAMPRRGYKLSLSFERAAFDKDFLTLWGAAQ